MVKVKTPRWAWALSGSGHFFKECLRMVGEFDPANSDRLKSLHSTLVIESLEQFETALARRKRDLYG